MKTHHAFLIAAGLFFGLLFAACGGFLFLGALLAPHQQYRIEQSQPTGFSVELPVGPPTLEGPLYQKPAPAQQDRELRGTIVNPWDK
jgi:hypothetical protein